MIRRRTLVWTLAIGSALAGCAFAQGPPPAQNTHMPLHAHGTFTVKMQPLSPAPSDGVMRMSIDKEVHGDLEGTTRGEMLSAGNPQAGSAGYVAMEIVTGKLNGKSGIFGLQHSATMDAGGQSMDIKVVPGSGTGELRGIAGNFKIIIADGKHSYEFEYTLPAGT